jgi:2-octaprenyl-6-methoxyphenol hydroxylase
MMQTSELTQPDADAVVVGGGLVGMAAAIACAKAGLRTIHLAPPGPPDRRTSALMGPSVDYLRSAGLVEDPALLGHRLSQIRIIDATNRLIRAPETVFDATEAGLDAFGWNFANIGLLERFQEVAATLPQLESRPLPLAGLERNEVGWRVALPDTSTISTALVVGADGKKSMVRGAAGIVPREHAFPEAALVCDLELGRPIGNTSIEFHYPHGPFTLVPAGGSRANLVWIDERSTLEAARAGGPEHLLAALRDRSQRLFGTLALAGPAAVFPLSTLSVDTAAADGVVLVGEAAHAFPPIGAQGLNLGLRDVADLAACLAARDGTEPGWAIALSRDYGQRRMPDLARTGGMVDALFRSLLADMLPAQMLRAGGLWALKLLPALRRQAFAVGMGGR